MTTVQTTREDHLIAWLTALAIAVHIIEATLPSPVPGIKPGLANILTIVIMLMFGWRTAVWVALLRVVVGSLIIGTFLSPTFVMSFSGALASVLVLGAAQYLPGRGFGPVGYSLLAALAHMAAQFWVAYTLFIPHSALFHLFPILMTAAVIFGVVNGIITYSVLKHLRGQHHEQPSL
jgi:heptaprenyl diphosphate synthase